MKGTNYMIEYIGIDIGGTDIKVGGMDKNEDIAFEYKEPTFKDVSTSDDLYIKIKNLIKKVPNHQYSKAIGIGVPGSVDLEKRQVLRSKNVALLNGFPLVEKLKKEFNKPVFLENDARVAAFSEAINGSGKGKNIVCYITISTGLGGGVIINKKIYHGSNNLGAYFARMILNGKNTSDSLISGTALLKMAKERICTDIQNTEELFELFKNGNETAVQIIEEFKQNLLVLLLNISSTINPDIIILGGGVLKSKECFIGDLINQFKTKAHPLAKITIIDIAKHKEPGIIGACLLAKINL